MTQRLVEIRSYQLKPGTLAEFDRLVRELSLPMLAEWGTDVVACGPSPHAPDCYFLARAYADLDDLNARQDAFYGSDAWRSGPRESIIGLIDSYLNTVLWLSEAAVEDMRAQNRR